MSRPISKDDLKLGEEYNVGHQRKGKFRMRVDSVRGEWIDGTVTKGKAGAMLSYNEVEEGGTITIRDSHSIFREVPQ